MAARSPGVAQLEERAHDGNLHIGSAIAVQNSGKHGNALLAEDIGRGRGHRLSAALRWSP